MPQTKEWRIENLYTIVDKNLNKIVFKKNKAQQDFDNNKHTRNIILKSRQLGFCLDPETRVLTSDLRWIRIIDLEPGTEIVSVDEYCKDGQGKSRKMRLGKVEIVSKVVREAFRITLEDGRSVICSAKHPWLGRKVATDNKWMAIEPGITAKSHLKVGNKLKSITIPWDNQASYEDGWFGGILDGEGSIGKKEHQAGISASQVAGFVWDRMVKYAEDNKYNYRVEVDKRKNGESSKFGSKDVYKICFGRMDEKFRLLGKTRPSRFIKNRFWENRELPGKKTGGCLLEVVKIEPLGERTLIDLQTSTKTFIAEGFVSHNTTYEAIDSLDDTLFTRGFSSLFIAHTKEDAIEIFDKKVDLAWRNINPNLVNLIWKVDTSTANKLKFDFTNGNFSQMTVSNSGRSGTHNRVHISEYAKLCAKYPAKADEIITGTIPSVPMDGRIDIESTAEGMGGHFYDIFWEAWNRQREPGKTEFKAHFYNWQWDEEDINKIVEIIPVSKMDESNKFKDYQVKHKLTDKEITYYYSKWLSLKRDWEKLHQEYPTTPEEAFVASGNTFFNKERIMYLLPDAPKPIEVNKSDIPEKLLKYYIDGDLLFYKTPEQLGSYVIAADVAEGKEGDSSNCILIDNNTFKPCAEFDSNKIRPDEFALLLDTLGRWYNNAYLGVESNAGLWVLTQLFESHMYPNLYWRETIDDVTHTTGRKLGFSTSSVSRKPMLDNLLVQVNLFEGIWTKRFLQQCLVFIKNDLGRPEAMPTKHDDAIIAMGILHYIRENVPSVKTDINTGELKTVAERIMARLAQHNKNNNSISQDNYL